MHESYGNLHQEQSLYSIQEEPPEVRTSINSHQFITPTPKFSNANKFRPQQTQNGNKENALISSKVNNQNLLPRVKLNKVMNGNYNSNSTTSNTN